MVQLPNPPEGGPGFDTADLLMADMNTFALRHGFQLVKRNGTNPDSKGQYTRYYVYCDRGAIRQTESHGVRRSATRKNGCPFMGSIKANKSTGHKWVFALHDPSKTEHNHEPSDGTTSHPGARRLIDEEKLMIRSMAATNIQPREIHAVLKQAYPDHAILPKDVENYIQKCRREKLDGFTGTQTFIKFLQNNNFPHRIKYEDDDPNRIAGAIWTYPWCIEMWKRYSEVSSFDNTYKTNRYHMPFFNVTGSTCTGSTYNQCFGVVLNQTRV